MTIHILRDAGRYWNMSRAQTTREAVGYVNGWRIVRYRQGSGCYWRAVRLDGDGSQINRSVNLPTRREAEQFAALH